MNDDSGEGQSEPSPRDSGQQAKKSTGRGQQPDQVDAQVSSASEADQQLAAVPQTEASDPPDAVTRTQEQSSHRKTRLLPTNWQTISVVAGLVFGAVTVVIGLIGYISPRSVPPSSPDLSVISRSIERIADVELRVEGESIGGGSSNDFSVQDNVIDVQLQNKGGTPALITAAEVSVSYARKMQLCPGIGGELLYANALYDVRIPAFHLPSIPTFPIKVTKELPFQVDPNSFDRLAVAIGPEEISSDDGPWVYILDVSLKMQNSEKVELGKFALLSPASQLEALEKNILEFPAYGQEYAECHEKNWESVSEATNSGGEVAPALSSLYSLYDSIPSLLAPGEERRLLTIGYDWSKVNGVVDCGNSGRPARGHMLAFVDVTGDANNDAIVALTCPANEDDYAFAPVSIVLIDGVLQKEHLRVMQTLFDSEELANFQAYCMADFRDGELDVKLISYPYGDTSRTGSIVVNHVFRWMGTMMIVIDKYTSQSCLR